MENVKTSRGIWKCGAPGCNSRPGKGYVFKYFPKDEILAHQWLQVLPVNHQIRPGNALCEKHFDDLQFERVGHDGKKKLKRNAIPSIFGVDRGRRVLGDVTNQQPVNQAQEAQLSLNESETADAAAEVHFGWKNGNNFDRTPSLLHCCSENVSISLLSPVPKIQDHNISEISSGEKTVLIESRSVGSNLLLDDKTGMWVESLSPKKPPAPSADYTEVRKPGPFDILDEKTGIFHVSLQGCISAEPASPNGSSIISTPPRKVPSSDQMDLTGSFSLQSPLCISTPTTRTNYLENSPGQSSLLSNGISDWTTYITVHDALAEYKEAYEALKKENEEQDRVIAELSANLTTKHNREYQAMKRTNSRLNCQLQRKLHSPWLSENQTKCLFRDSNRGMKWDSQCIRDGLILKMKSGTGGYSAFVKKYPLLPSVRSLQEAVQFIKFDSGILEDMIDLLEMMVKQMSDIEKDCILILDETIIQEGAQMATLPSHFGKATKALLFILAGVARRWRVAVAVYFTSKRRLDLKNDKQNTTGKDYQKIVHSIACEAQRIGLKPCAVVSDMGPDNLALWKAFGVSGGKSGDLSDVKCQYSTDLRPEEKFNVMPDVVHLFKSIKSMIESNITIRLPKAIVEEEQLPSDVVDYRHIQDLYEYEKGSELKIAFRLKPENIHVGKHFPKMKTGTAKAVLCHRTGVGLTKLAEEQSNPSYRTTAWFVLFLNTFIQLATSRSPKLAVSRKNNAVFEKTIGLIKKMDLLFANMSVGDNGYWKPCQRGMRVLCAGLLHLIYHFLDNRGYTYLILGRFTSDVIENMFSLIRFRQPVPHAVAFLQCLKVITLAQFAEAVKGSSYDYDETESLQSHGGDFLDEARRRAKERAVAKFYNSLEELFANPVRKVTDADFMKLNKWEKFVIYDMAGSTLCSLFNSNISLCQGCIAPTKWEGTTLHPSAAVTEMKEFTMLRSDDGKRLLQIYVSDEVYKVIMSAEVTFRMNREATLYFKHLDVQSYFVDNLMYLWEGSRIPDCHNMKRKILEFFISGRLKEYKKIVREDAALIVSNQTKLVHLASRSVAMREAASKI